MQIHRFLNKAKHSVIKEEIKTILGMLLTLFICTIPNFPTINSYT